ncbi:M20 family metallopeptidase [Allostreptomyces psammosilenae]|uniref:Succinyl-diaminopimelate desuccinylase n=1 Tax=Allostreptomyces psammosilenae TaxID=1892865 RepID=A0A853ABC0_9ACTN|nr:M20/M25/M40 family metallo-hydrolase [Allostreptomyces psammosilenae]NYI07788.1 succinyl-diaminopimelate desuccinylase [Allostreptomyces psammosilenae]
MPEDVSARRRLALRASAEEDQESVLALARELVRLPSRGGIDPYQPVLDHVAGWLHHRGLRTRPLHDGAGACVGLVCEVAGAAPGPRWVLDACLDTAPFGDESAWSRPPTSAALAEGWLYGRGAADSKTTAAIFCHIAVRMARQAHRLRGTLTLLFDVDEHTGHFGGAKRYFEGPGAPDDAAGVMIGYPGIDHLVVGGRGVYRARLSVHGTASHSGGSAVTPNAIVKAADVVRTLHALRLPGGTPTFRPAGKLTITGVSAGQGYSVTPDLCLVNVDVRTTPTFTSQAAATVLGRAVRDVDAAWPTTRPTTVTVETDWPPYALPEEAPLRRALLDAAERHGLTVAPKVAGPSNIGNYLAGLGIPATAGFGPDYRGLHATDERVRVSTIPLAQAVYHDAVLELLTTGVAG